MPGAARINMEELRATGRDLLDAAVRHGTKLVHTLFYGQCGGNLQTSAQSRYCPRKVRKTDGTRDVLSRQRAAEKTLHARCRCPGCHFVKRLCRFPFEFMCNCRFSLLDESVDRFKPGLRRAEFGAAADRIGFMPFLARLGPSETFFSGQKPSGKGLNNLVIACEFGRAPIFLLDADLLISNIGGGCRGCRNTFGQILSSLINSTLSQPLDCLEWLTPHYRHPRYRLKL